MAKHTKLTVVLSVYSEDDGLPIAKEHTYTAGKGHWLEAAVGSDGGLVVRRCSNPSEDDIAYDYSECAHYPRGSWRWVTYGDEPK